MVLSIIDIYNVVKNFVTVTLLFIKLEEQSKEKKRKDNPQIMFMRNYTRIHISYMFIRI